MALGVRVVGEGGRAGGGGGGGGEPPRVGYVTPHPFLSEERQEIVI